MTEPALNVSGLSSGSLAGVEFGVRLHHLHQDHATAALAALTDPAFTRRYWGVALHSDWRKGSAMTWEENGVTMSDPEQVVLEADPHRRLSYTWHTFTPEWAKSHGFDEELLRKLAGERRSRVTFDIEQWGQQVKLTVVHDEFEPDSTVRTMISEGRPALLSSLKTLLETGEVLPQHGS